MSALRKYEFVPVTIDHGGVAASALAEAAKLFIAANELLAGDEAGKAAWNLEKSKQWMNMAITHMKLEEEVKTS